MTDAERIAALEAALADVLKRLDPQTLAQALERTWSPRGGEPRIVDSTGRTLDYTPSIQFLNATTELDVPAQRVVVTPTGGAGGHVILDPDTGLAMPAEPNLFLTAANPTGALDIDGIDIGGLATVILFTLGALIQSHDVQVFDTPGTHTWTKPTDPLNSLAYATVVVAEPGGGGGSGARAAGGTTAGGGGGGGGGAVLVRHCLASELGATEPVEVGAPGAGGATAGAAPSSGSAGGNAGATYFRSQAFTGSSTPAQGGAAGLVSGTAAGGVGAVSHGTQGGTGGAGDGTSGAAGSNGNPPGAPGGGGGGNLSAGSINGGTGGSSGPAGGTGGAGGAVPVAGLDGATEGTTTPAGGGGGGGGAGSAAGGAGITAGGGGGQYGGGGGGGGGDSGSRDTHGGTGGPGIVVVIIGSDTYTLT